MNDTGRGARPAPVVLGVTVHQPHQVLEAALQLARRFGTWLVCAHVDASSYVVEEHPDGTVEARPVDPDLPDWTSRQTDPAVAERLRAAGAAQGVDVEVRDLAGDVGEALAHLADTLSAQLIVVGSRRGGVRASMHDLLGGSVAAHLIHRQSRPVLVIPFAPSSDAAHLPGDAAS